MSALRSGLAAQLHTIMAGAVAPPLVDNTMSQLRSAFANATSLEIAGWLGGHVVATKAQAAPKAAALGTAPRPQGFKRGDAVKASLKEKILAYLAGEKAATGASTQEICSHIRESKDYTWAVLLRELRDAGQVVLTGDRKAARYHAATSPAAVAASEPAQAAPSPATAIDATQLPASAFEDAEVTPKVTETSQRVRNKKRRAA